MTAGIVLAVLPKLDLYDLGDGMISPSCCMLHALGKAILARMEGILKGGEKTNTLST